MQRLLTDACCSCTHAGRTVLHQRSVSRRGLPTPCPPCHRQQCRPCHHRRRQRHRTRPRRPRASLPHRRRHQAHTKTPPHPTAVGRRARRRALGRPLHSSSRRPLTPSSRRPIPRLSPTSRRHTARQRRRSRSSPTRCQLPRRPRRPRLPYPRRLIRVPVACAAQRQPPPSRHSIRAQSRPFPATDPSTATRWRGRHLRPSPPPRRFQTHQPPCPIGRPPPRQNWTFPTSTRRLTHLPLRRKQHRRGSTHLLRRRRRRTRLRLLSLSRRRRRPMRLLPQRPTRLLPQPPMHLRRARSRLRTRCRQHSLHPSLMCRRSSSQSMRRRSSSRRSPLTQPPPPPPPRPIRLPTSLLGLGRTLLLRLRTLLSPSTASTPPPHRHPPPPRLSPLLAPRTPALRLAVCPAPCVPATRARSATARIRAGGWHSPSSRDRTERRPIPSGSSGSSASQQCQAAPCGRARCQLGVRWAC